VKFPGGEEKKLVTGDSEFLPVGSFFNLRLYAEFFKLVGEEVEGEESEEEKAVGGKEAKAGKGGWGGGKEAKGAKEGGGKEAKGAKEGGGKAAKPAKREWGATLALDFDMGEEEEEDDKGKKGKMKEEAKWGGGKKEVWGGKKEAFGGKKEEWGGKKEVWGGKKEEAGGGKKGAAAKKNKESLDEDEISEKDTKSPEPQKKQAPEPAGKKKTGLPEIKSLPSWLVEDDNDDRDQETNAQGKKRKLPAWANDSIFSAPAPKKLKTANAGAVKKVCPLPSSSLLFPPVPPSLLSFSFLAPPFSSLLLFVLPSLFAPLPLASSSLLFSSSPLFPPLLLFPPCSSFLSALLFPLPSPVVRSVASKCCSGSSSSKTQNTKTDSNSDFCSKTNSESFCWN
jgi:hypothetical protein